MVQDSLSFDELAAWYTQEGYKVAPWLELLDLNKWAVGAAAPSSSANGKGNNGCDAWCFSEDRLFFVWKYTQIHKYAYIRIYLLYAYTSPSPISHMDTTVAFHLFSGASCT